VTKGYVCVKCGSQVVGHTRAECNAGQITIFESEVMDLRHIIEKQEYELFSQKLLTDHYREALLWILAEPHGCAFCDSGKLRNLNKGHDERCGFAKAQDLIGGCNDQID
jgi:hypothetical protein